MSSWLAVVLVWAIAVLSASAQTNRYVSTNGSSTIPYDTWLKAGTSLIGVVSYANTFNEGDTVWVSNGVYVLTNTVTVANTMVQGAGASRSDVVVNGAGLYRCFALTHAGSVVAGLTISNGWHNQSGSGAYLAAGMLSNCAVVNNLTTGLYAYGGGVYVATGAVVGCLISGNTVAKHSTGSGGGGIGLLYSGVISNCIIINNVSKEPAEQGGGGVAIAGNGIIDGCIITGNVSDVIGGGLFIKDNAVARNCLISGNSTFGIYASPDYFGGGGVAFNRGGMVSNCLITGNYSGKHGGGVYIYRGTSLQQHGILQHCRIFANTALTNGGGVYTQHDVLSGLNEIVNCVITGNTAGASGGGVGLYGSSGLIRGCLIADNTAVVSGGGWYSRWYAGNMQNCTIVRNSAPSGGGMTFSFAYFTNINSIMYFNVGGANSNWSGNDADTLFTNCCTAPLRGNGNITVDPMLANIPSDCRLLRGSPCINTGLYQDWMPNAVDVDCRPRIREKYVDIGAYESFPKGTMYIGK